MATVLSTLYPPLIGTFQPAFVYNDGPEISFSISNYNSYLKIKHIHISLVNQKTNQNAFAINKNSAYEVPFGTYLIDGIWIVPFKADSSQKIFTYFDNKNNSYKIKIPNTILKNKSTNFITDYYYKVQLRFDCVTDDIISSTDSSQNIFNSTYLNNYKTYFSEWSSISLLKAIPEVDIQVTNFTIVNNNGLSNSNLRNKIPQFTPGIIPIVGKLEFFKNDESIKGEKELIKNYQIKIYKKEDELSKIKVLDSGTIYPENYKFNENKLNTSINSQSEYWTNNFSYLADLTNQDSDYNYILNIIICTKNNYIAEKSFIFKLTNALFTPNWKWSFDEKQLPYYGNIVEKVVTEEDGEIAGKVEIEYNSNSESMNYKYQQEPGYMFIRRADSLDNFKKWTIIKCIKCKNSLTPVNFTDKTVGSLVRYRYSAQYLCLRGGIQTPVSKSPIIIYPDFHDILISSGDKQLAIRYNGQINSMTPVVNRVKIDTLGGQYPKFAENAKLNYKQFNLSGLLIAESDYNRKFLNDLDYSADMQIYNDTQNGTYLVRNDTILENFDSDHPYGTYTKDIINKTSLSDDQKESSQKNTNHDIYPTNNWWWERKFREEVVKWLNNGKPKLYRSMTEGNMIVMFDGITLTPNNQLGRRVWNISCTVYEIGNGYDLESLNEFDIFPIQNDYSNKTFDYLDNEDSLTTQTITVLNQQYETKALKDEFGNFLDIVNNNEIRKTINNNTIVDNINFLYQGVGKNYKYIDGSALLHNLKITFTSPPRYFYLKDNDYCLYDFSEDKDISFEDIFLGYRLKLSYYNIYTNASTNIPIFVQSIDNQTGYYQVPSNLVISGITLYDDAVATLDYYLTYKIEYYNIEIPDYYSQEETLVGQVSDYWSFGTDISNYINEKYRVYNWTPDNDYEYIEGLIYWKGLNIESDPYSIYEIVYKEGINNVINNNETNQYIIPRTGTLNLAQNYAISSCRALGKQMFVVDEKRKPYLDEWECVLDESVLTPYEPGNTVSDGEYWYLVKGSDNIELDTDENNNYILVKIRITDGNIYIVNNNSENSNTYISWDDFNNGILDIYEDWFNLDAINNYIVENIKKPDYNKVYKIIDNNFIFYNMIYYLNQGWYPIDFMYDSDYTVMQAKVPISGMIEYKANIYQQGWEVIDNKPRSGFWGNEIFNENNDDTNNDSIGG